MTVPLLHIEDLPRRNATQVKNKWGDVIRELRTRGSVAITSHENVEVVMVTPETYRMMMSLVAAAEERRGATLAELAAEFDQHLAGLQKADARERIDAMMESRGHVKPRPKAGPSY